MAFAPNTSPFITTALDNVDLPNSQVLAAGAGLQIISSGPGGNVTINPTQNLLSLTQIAADGILSINHSTNTIFTRTLSSDGTLTITNANGVSGSPLFSVTPQSQVQLIQVSANGGSIVGQAPTLNFSGAGNTSVSAVNEGSFINIVISSTGGGGGGGVSQVDTGTGLTGGPITSTGTISIANTAVTAGTYANPSNLVVNAQGQITSIANGSGGGAVSSVASSNNNQILASPTTGSVLLSLPTTMIAPGTFSATTSISTPILSITGAFNNPFSVQPGSNGQVLSCSTGGVLAWINNGSGGSGVSSVGISSPFNTLTVGSSTTNPITSIGTLQVDLVTSGISPGSFGTPASINVNAYGIVTNIVPLAYALPTTTGTPGQVITYPSSGGQTTWQTPSGGGGISAVNGTSGQVTASTVSGVVTLGLDNPLVAPGAFVANGSITTPALSMSDFATYTYALPITNGTSGQFLQSVGGGQCIWATAGGGGGGTVTSIIGTVNQIEPHVTAITTSGTLSLSSTLIAPGTFQATTSIATPVLSMSDGSTYNYNLPITNGTTGQFLQSIGGGQTIWASGGGGGGGVPTVQGTSGQILVNGVTTPISAAATLTIPNAFVAPGSIAATTSISTPAFTMSNGSTYSYSLPTSNGTIGQVLSSNGGGATTWVPAGGGGGGVSSVSTAITNSTGLMVTPTTGAVTIQWDATQNAVLPQSLELNATGTTGTQYSFPTTAGVPGSTLRWPNTSTSGVYQLYWEDPYLVLDITSSDFVITKTPTYAGSPFFDAVASLPTSGPINFPGSLNCTALFTIPAPNVLTISGSQPLNPWNTFPSAPGGIIVCDTSGNITYNASIPSSVVQTAQPLNFAFTGGTVISPFNVSYSIIGTTVTARINISAFQSVGLVCDGSGAYITFRSDLFTSSSPILPLPTNANQINTFLGSLPIYSPSGTAQSYYSYWYLIQAIPGYFQIVCSLGISSNATLGTFVNTNTYFFGVDGNLSGVPATAPALTFTYSIHP